MKRFGMLCALLAGALLASQAQAQQPGQAYFGAGVSSVWTKGAFPPEPGVPLVEEDTSAGFKLYGGKMWSNFGMEIGAYSLGKYDVELLGAKIAESKTMAIAVSGVYATDISAGFTFHAKLGLAFTQHDLDCPTACTTTSNRKRGMSGLLGVGFGSKLTQDVLVRLDYEHFGSVHHAAGFIEYEDSYDTFGVSLQFNF
ncbi:MAG: outer membrane beta-barrel protein [Burkholderiales bacterium]